MAKTKIIGIRVTLEQDELLEKRSASAGFNKKSEYIRSQLFRLSETEMMIKEIYERVVKNG